MLVFCLNLCFVTVLSILGASSDNFLSFVQIPIVDFKYKYQMSFVHIWREGFLTCYS